MAIQQLATLWTPAVWIQGIAEKQATFPALFNSKAVKRTNLLDELVAGPGTEANIPFLKDITDQSNEVQVEHTAPVTINGSPGATAKLPILNRVTKNSWTAMAKNVSGANVMAHVWGSMAQRRLKQYQTTLIAQLRGVCGTASTINAAAPLTDTRYGGTTAEPCSENGLNPGPSQLITPDIFIRTCALMGELADTLKDGACLMHPDIKAALMILDVYGFKTLVMPSELPYSIDTYRGIPIFQSQSLRRAATGGGYVYDTYLIAAGSIGFGEKPQVADQADLASLSYFYDRDLNDDLIWDRNRISMGPDGMAFDNSAIAGSSATDAELQTSANWSLKYQTANRVGIAAIRTNG